VTYKLLAALAILAITGGASLSRGQQKRILSTRDKAEIIEWVLQDELKAQTSIPEFAQIRIVSSENIEFFEPARLTKHGFTLVAASQLRESKQDHVVQYLLFDNISLRDGIAVQVVSRVTQGRPCFGEPFSSERSYRYEFTWSSAGWTGEGRTRYSLPVDR
jgi:hypothetical protein